MEQKTTQRIIGIFVLVALVVIALPLFLNKNNSSSLNSMVKATPVNPPATVQPTVASAEITEPGQPTTTAPAMTSIETPQPTEVMSPQQEAANNATPVAPVSTVSASPTPTPAAVTPEDPVITPTVASQVNENEDPNCTQLVVTPIAENHDLVQQKVMPAVQTVAKLSDPSVIKR